MPNKFTGPHPKFVIPSVLKYELTRPSLIEEIEQSADFTLLVLTAPIGFGKTTTLAQWARATRSRVAWLNLDSEDEDPSQLARSLSSSIKAAEPLLKLEKFETARGLQSPEASAFALAEDLNTSASNLRIIVDQAQHLGPEAAHWMELFCTNLAEGHQLILSGYTEPKLRLGRLITQGRVRAINPKHLEFSLEEAKVFLASHGYQGDPMEAYQWLEGWPAGLAMIAQEAHTKVPPEKLVDEMLDTLETPLQEVLPELSVLEVWSETEAESFGVSLPEGWLERVRDSGLPMTPLGGGVYRPHTLLLRALDARLCKRPARRKELHRQAALMAEQAGNSLTSIQHYLAAKCFDDARRLAEQVVARLEARSEFRLVRQVLEAFPKNQLSDKLQDALAVAYIYSGETQRTETLMQKLYANGIFQRRGYFSLGLVAARKGDTSQALGLFEQGLAQGGNDLLENRLRRNVAHSLVKLGLWERAIVEAERCVKWAAQAGDSLELAKSRRLLVWPLASQRRFEEAESTLLRALRVYQEEHLIFDQISVYNDLAELCRLTNRPQEALQHVERALALPGAEDSLNFQIIVETKADCYIWLNEFALARDNLLLALERNVLRYLAVEQRVLYKLAEVCCRLGDLEAAENWVLQARAVPLQPQDSTNGVVHFYEGIFHFFTGQLQGARKHFEAALARPLQRDRQARSHLYLAEIARLEGHLEHLHVQQLRQAIEQLGNAGVLAVDGAALGKTLEELLALGLPKKYFEMAQAGSLRVDATPTRLRMYLSTLGEFAVKIEGRPVAITHSKAREILVWLALNGKGSRGQIVDALWDGSDDYRHIDYFKISVRRLRSALASHPLVDFDPVPFEGGLYRLGDRLEVQVDVVELERLLALGSAEDLEMALKVYRGTFLPEVEAGWVELIRTRALDAALAAAASLGEMLAKDNPTQAAWAFQKLVELDPLAEASYIKLLRVLRRLGDHPRAKLVFHSLVRMLADEYGADPDPAVVREFGDLVE